VLCQTSPSLHCMGTALDLFQLPRASELPTMYALVPYLTFLGRKNSTCTFSCPPVLANTAKRVARRPWHLIAGPWGLSVALIIVDMVGPWNAKQREDRDALTHSACEVADIGLGACPSLPLPLRNISLRHWRSAYSYKFVDPGKGRRKLGKALRGCKGQK